MNEAARHAPATRLRVWLHAARSRTLPAVVAPVLAGTAAAGGPLRAGRFALALLVGLALQVGVNYANDYFDGVRGVDTAQRVGPPRAVASGWVSAPAMRRAMIAALAVAALAGLALALLVDLRLLPAGALALLAAVAYSGGPRPYASAGLGELFVFVFFGVVATAGSAYVQHGTLPVAALAAALPMGLLASALLLVNNLRDIGTDRAAGKVTLAVRLGPARSRRLFAALLWGALLAVPLVAWAAGALPPLAALLAAPLAIPPLRTVRHETSPAALIAALGATARLELALALLLAAGLWLA